MPAQLRCLFCLAGLLLLTGCWDPPPAEIGMRIMKDGESYNALVMVFTAEGKQIQQVGADALGVLYVKGLTPGTYTFKFQGSEGQMYPAVRTVTLGEGASSFLEVDLNKAKDPEGEAKATEMGKTAGSGSGEHEESP